MYETDPIDEYNTYFELHQDSLNPRCFIRDINQKNESKGPYKDMPIYYN